MNLCGFCLLCVLYKFDKDRSNESHFSARPIQKYIAMAFSFIIVTVFFSAIGSQVISKFHFGMEQYLKDTFFVYIFRQQLSHRTYIVFWVVKQERQKHSNFS